MAATSMEILFETLLAVPGMHDPVKIDLKIPRKTVLLLTEVIARGMNQKTDLENGILRISKESAAELQTIIDECLEKSGLTSLNAKLREINLQS